MILAMESMLSWACEQDPSKSVMALLDEIYKMSFNEEQSALPMVSVAYMDI